MDVVARLDHTQQQLAVHVGFGRHNSRQQRLSYGRR
jgi:hypothetical protein